MAWKWSDWLLEMTRVRDIALAIMIASGLSACMEDCLKAKTNEVRNVLNREIKAGDTRERVDEVLNSARIGYGYDRFSNRYQSTVTDAQCGPYQAISIYVYFDASGKVSKVEVFESYTGPIW